MWGLIEEKPLKIVKKEMETMKVLSFNAVDVETANWDPSSICQIGIVQVREGQIRKEWQTLINPECAFDPFNVDIHGIDEDKVLESPTFVEAYNDLCAHLDVNLPAVSHMLFDRRAIQGAIEMHSLDALSLEWINSATVVRRAWPDKYARRGYSLGNLAKDFGIKFDHHDALEDARTCAKIVLLACKEKNVDLSIVKTKKSKTPPPISRKGDISGHLTGETVVFTGTLSVPRGVIADYVASAGCDVGTSVTKKTTMLVLGIQDPKKIKGQSKSSKHRKAENLISSGQNIRILIEDDFRELLNPL